MSIDIDAKLRAAAEILEGRAVQDQPGVPVYVKGSIFGFPASLRAIGPGWPFGVMYFLETQVVEDPSRPGDERMLEMTISPRYGRGLWAIFTRIVLFESQGMNVGDKFMESQFIFKYNERALAERFIKYPGVADNLVKLERYTNFTEMQIKSKAGIFVSQPTSFKALSLDVCRESFRILGEIGQVLFEAF